MQYTARETQINADFSGAVVQPGAPNEGLIDKIKQQDKELRQKVYDAWVTFYAEQKKSITFPTKELGEPFRKEFEKLQLPKDQLDANYLDI